MLEMNESEEHKELIYRISETLRNHMEPYKQGAWERFSAARGITPRKRVLWPYWSAAAVLLLAGALFWFHRTSDAPMVVASGGLPETPGASSPLASVESAASTESSGTVDQIVASSGVERQSVSVDAVVEERPMEWVAADEGEPETAEAPKSAPEEVPAPVEESFAQTAQRLAIGDHEGTGYAAVNREVRDNTERKWDLGVAIAPSMTREKLNVSGGIAIAYQLSDKFSVGSGVSIGRLGLGENRNYDPSSGNPPVYGSPTEGIQGLARDREQYKRDVSLTSNVVALDIPLDLRYEVFNGFYTSVGVSYVAVLSEQRTEHYIGGINEATFAPNKGTDKNLTASTTVGYRAEKMNVQPLRGKGYTGFMNFSVGRKVSLSKYLFISVEPYFKLPIGQLSKEQMDFTNGGIRIVTGF